MSFAVANITSGQPGYLNPDNWHPGDGHMHSQYSRLCLDILLFPIRWLIDATIGNGEIISIDGHGEPAQVSKCASRLDWVCMTEHGPNLGFPKLLGRGMNLFGYSMKFALKTWAALRKDLEAAEAQSKPCCRCMIRAEELSNCWQMGHLLAYGSQLYIKNSPKLRMGLFQLLKYLGIDDQYLAQVAELQQAYLDSVANQTDGKGFCYVAHPAKQGYYSWQGFDDLIWQLKDNAPLRGFEFLNGVQELETSKELEKKWDDWLRTAYRVRIIGGSDGHYPDKVGQACRTFVYVEPGVFSVDTPQDKQEEAVLLALRWGNSVVTQGPLAVFTVENGSQNVVIGERLWMRPGDTLTVRLAFGDAARGLDCPQHEIICGFSAGEKEILRGGWDPAQRMEIEKVQYRELPTDLQQTSNTTYSIQVPDDPKLKSGYIRVRGWKGDKFCYTNPVFLLRDPASW